KFNDLVWPDVKESLLKVSGSTDATVTFKMHSIADVFPEKTVAALPADEPIYAGALIRLQTFRDVLPARREVQKQEFAKDLELEPKGGQVVALERFESISGIMSYGDIALKVTFAISLAFIIGITAYMHVMSKTSDIGILRTYGLSPWSIAWVYTLEL